MDASRCILDLKWRRPQFLQCSSAGLKKYIKGLNKIKYQVLKCDMTSHLVKCCKILGEGMVFLRDLEENNPIAVDHWTSIFSKDCFLKKCNDLDMVLTNIEMSISAEAAKKMLENYSKEKKNVKTLRHPDKEIGDYIVITSRAVKAGEQLSNWYGPLWWMRYFADKWLEETKTMDVTNEEWLSRWHLLKKWYSGLTTYEEEELNTLFKRLVALTRFLVERNI
jgi:hypothetical protein